MAGKEEAVFVPQWNRSGADAASGIRNRFPSWPRRRSKALSWLTMYLSKLFQKPLRGLLALMKLARSFEEGPNFGMSNSPATNRRVWVYPWNPEWRRARATRGCRRPDAQCCPEAIAESRHSGSSARRWNPTSQAEGVANGRSFFGAGRAAIEVRDVEECFLGNAAVTLHRCFRSIAGEMTLHDLIHAARSVGASSPVVR